MECCDFDAERACGNKPTILITPSCLPLLALKVIPFLSVISDAASSILVRLSQRELDKCRTTEIEDSCHGNTHEQLQQRGIHASVVDDVLPCCWLLSFRECLWEWVASIFRPGLRTPQHRNSNQRCFETHTHTSLVATIHFCPFACCFCGFLGRSFTGFFRNENAEFTESHLRSLFTI